MKKEAILIFVIILLIVIFFPKISGKVLYGSVPPSFGVFGWNKTCFGFEVKPDGLVGGGDVNICYGLVGKKTCYGIKNAGEEIKEMSCGNYEFNY